MVFPIIVATNNCGLVGNAYTSWTLGVPEHQLSTYQEFYGTKAFNPADLGCPHPLQGRDLDDPGLTEAAEGMDPSVLLPADLTNLDPAWKSCTLLPLGLGRDPPRALEPATNLAPQATSYQASLTASQSVPHPHSLPKSPGPIPTSSSPPTEITRLSSPDNTATSADVRLQKLPSVCSPIPRSRTSSSTSADSPSPQSIGPVSSSPNPDIRPRNEAASAVERSTTSGLSLSGAAVASSYASYTSGIEAWANGMVSEASVMRLPPVAPSNPYMALPKHRSANRHRNSTMTGSRVSQNFSEIGVTSEPQASTSSEMAPLMSATHQSTPSLPSAEIPAIFPAIPPLQSTPTAPPESNSIGNEDAQYGDCDQAIVVDLAITTTSDIGNDLSPSLSTSTESTSLAPLSIQRVSSSDLNEASLHAPKFSSVKTAGQGLSSIVITQASIGSYASLVTSITDRPTTSASSGSARGFEKCVAGASRLWAVGLGITIFIVLN